MYGLIKKNYGVIFIFSVAVVVTGLIFSTFSYPPFSDSWQDLYFFHHLDEMPGKIKWLHVLNIDPFENMRYQPLSRVFSFILYKTFGSAYVSVRISNLFMYLLFIYLMFLLVHKFTRDTLVIVLFTGLFSIFFSHFDILVWTHHIYIITGFCSFLAGFLCYIRYMRTRYTPLIFLMAVLFLTGMWCYETFILWPFAILILSSIRSLPSIPIPSRRGFTFHSLVLAGIYAVYTIFFYLTRMIGTHAVPRYSLTDLFSFANAVKSCVILFFNLLYNNIAVNILPFLPFPLDVRDNIYMSGPLLRSAAENRFLVFFTGGIVMACIIYAGYLLYRKGLKEEIRITGFFLFLLFTEKFVLIFFRLISHSFLYCLTEFRYQYISNALVVMCLIYLIGRFLNDTRKKRLLIYVIPLIAMMNIYSIRKSLDIYETHFSGLKKMISGLRQGIKEGRIDSEEKVYIPEDITEDLPSLCWNNRDWKGFIREGNYMWLFSEKELVSFSSVPDDAYWTIERKTMEVIRRPR